MDKILIRKKATLVLALFTLFIAWRLSAQFGVEQPFWKRELAPSAETFATNLAHRWVYTNLATNARIAVWTDIINSYNLGPYGAHLMTNTANGVLFESAGSGLTNANGLISRLIFNANPDVTNWAMGFIFRMVPGQSDARSFAWVDQTLSGTRYQFSGGDNGDLYMFRQEVPNFELFPPAAMNPTNWFDVVLASTNSNAGVRGSANYLNGVYSTNRPFTMPKAIGIFDTNSSTPPDIFGLRAWIREIWIRTNVITAAGLDGMASDIHWVKTNIYQLPNN